MAEIVNLRRARKKQARAEKEKMAEANRVAHGTPKALRNLAQARGEQAEKAHSAHRLEKEPDDN